jgi:hypothetical protein
MSNCQIIGDGGQLVIIEPSYGCYILDRIYLTNLSMRIDQPSMDIRHESGYQYRIPIGMRSVEVQVSLKAGDCQQQKSFGLLDSNLIKKLTILELFQIVRQRLNEREGETNG